MCASMYECFECFCWTRHAGLASFIFTSWLEMFLQDNCFHLLWRSTSQKRRMTWLSSWLGRLRPLRKRRLRWRLVPFWFAHKLCKILYDDGNSRLFMAPHLVRARGTYKSFSSAHSSHSQTHACMHTHTYKLAHTHNCMHTYAPPPPLSPPPPNTHTLTCISACSLPRSIDAGSFVLCLQNMNGLQNVKLCIATWIRPVFVISWILLPLLSTRSACCLGVPAFVTVSCS